MKTKTYTAQYSEGLFKRLLKLGFTPCSHPTDYSLDPVTFLLIDWDTKRVFRKADTHYVRNCSYVGLSLEQLTARIDWLELDQWESEKGEKIECFEPFDRILVRNYENIKWKPALFSHYNADDTYPYRCVGAILGYKYAIPYEGNEHLANK